MNILLIDINNNSRYKDFVPLALLRLATKHKADNVELIFAGKTPKRKPDIIYFSLIFLFQFKRDIEWILTYKQKYKKAKFLIGGISISLQPEKYLKYLDEDEVFVGRDLELEKLTPDFDIANKDYSYGFTMRGCHNKCEWCVVPVLEGKHKKVDNWQSQIDTSKKVFYCFDNNIFSCGSKHLESVLSFCDKHNIKIDFNQGLDAELFYKNKKIQDVFLKYKHCYQNIRFAWDSHRVDESIKFMFDFVEKNNIKCRDGKLIYMLYDNEGNAPEDVFNRIKYILNLKGNWAIKLMRFKNLENGKYGRAWGSIGDLFSDHVNYSCTGLISVTRYYNYLYSYNLDMFINILGGYRDYIRSTKGRGKNTDKFIKYCDNIIKAKL